VKEPYTHNFHSSGFVTVKWSSACKEISLKLYLWYVIIMQVGRQVSDVSNIGLQLKKTFELRVISSLRSKS